MDGFPPSVARFSFSVQPRLILRIGLAVAVALVVISWLIQVPQIYKLSLDDVVGQKFAVTEETTLPAWVSSSGLLAAAAMLWSIGRSADRWRRHWRGLALLFAALSLDEAIALHEATIRPLRDAFDLGGAFLFAWVIPGGIAVAVVTLVLWRFVWALEPPVRWIVILAAVLFVGGALGMELVGGVISDSQGERNVTYITVASIEELMEMAGTVVFLYGLAMFTRDRSTAELGPVRR